MGTGYTRNDTANNIADGNVINASDLDGEFDAVQAAFNGTTGHSHDGTSGEGPQIDTAGIAADAVDGTKIADDSIDSEHYVDGSIDTAHIGNLQVTTAKIAADAIDGTKLADNAVDSEHYTDGSIDRVHLAADIIDGTKIADDVINSEHYVAGSIDAEHLASNSVTSAKLDTNIQVAGTLGVTGETTLTTHLNMGDNDAIKLGDSADLQLYHDGLNSYILDTGVGSLNIRGTNLLLQAYNGDTYINCTEDGAVDLRHDNSPKLATTATGVSVTGTASATTFSGDLNGTINTATTAATQTAGDNTTKVATTAFVTTAVNNAEPFPSGTSMLFQQTSAPTGWTKQTSHNNKAIRLTTGTVGTGGSSAFTTALGTPSVAGGSVSGTPGNNQSVSAGNLAVASGNLAVSISGNIANTTLTTSQIPSHSHNVGPFRPAGNSGLASHPVAYRHLENAGNSTKNLVSSNTGSSGSHNHGHNLSGNMTGSPSLSGSPTLSGNVTAGNLAVGASTASINVQYVDFIIANKD